MRRMMGVLTSCVCLGLAPIAGAVDGVGGAAGGAVGGALSGGGPGGGPGGGAAGAGAAAAAARVRVPGRGAAGASRPVGANFGPARAGLSGGVSASASGPGVGASAAAGANARAGLRGGAASGPGDTRGESSPRRSAGAGNAHDGVHPQHNHLLLQADLVFARRLAEIDRLRDVALTSGNEGLLVRADQLEQQARVQHDHRIEQVTTFQNGPHGPREDQFRGEGQLSGQLGGEAQAATATQNSPVTWFDPSHGVWVRADAQPMQAGMIQGGVEQSARTDITTQLQGQGFGRIDGQRLSAETGAAAAAGADATVARNRTDEQRGFFPAPPAPPAPPATTAGAAVSGEVNASTFPAPTEASQE